MAPVGHSMVNIARHKCIFKSSASRVAHRELSLYNSLNPGGQFKFRSHFKPQGTLHQVPSTWCQVPDSVAWYLVPCTRELLPSSPGVVGAWWHGQAHATKLLHPILLSGGNCFQGWGVGVSRQMYPKLYIFFLRGNLRQMLADGCGKGSINRSPGPHLHTCTGALPD